jgi:hypothetical protein
MINDQDNIYSRTQAFNFLKELLEVPQGALINLQFFRLFFSGVGGGKYFIKTNENCIRQIFKEKGIVELNRQYYYYKKIKTPGSSMKTEQIFEEAKIRIQDAFVQISA